MLKLKNTMVTPNPNPNYEYEDQDIQKLLNLRIQGLALTDVYVAPPLSNTANYGLKSYLKDEATQYRHISQRTCLIAYNLDLGHWVGICIKIEGQVVSVLYIDPLDKVIPNRFDREAQRLNTPLEIENIILSIYPASTIERVIYFNQIEEGSKTSCGVLTIENLSAACYQNPLTENTSVAQITEFRRQHIELMCGDGGDLTFSDRQSNNIMTVAGIPEQRDYIKYDSIIKFTEIQQLRIEKIIQLIQQLPSPHQLILSQAFKQKIGDGSDSHRYYLNGVREKIKEVSEETNLEENTIFSEFILELFGVEIPEYRDNQQLDFKIIIEVLQAIGSRMASQTNVTASSVSTKEQNSKELAPMPRERKSKGRWSRQSEDPELSFVQKRLQRGQVRTIKSGEVPIPRHRRLDGLATLMQGPGKCGAVHCSDSKLTVSLNLVNRASKNHVQDVFKPLSEIALIVSRFEKLIDNYNFYLNPNESPEDIFKSLEKEGGECFCFQRW